MVANPYDLTGPDRKSRAAARALLRRAYEAYPNEPTMKAAERILIEEAHKLPLRPSPPPKSRASSKGFTINQSRRIWDRDGWTCVTCGTHADLSVDHILPVSRGGSDDDANLQAMCRPCNSRKGNR